MLSKLKPFPNSHFKSAISWYWKLLDHIRWLHSLNWKIVFIVTCTWRHEANINENKHNCKRIKLKRHCLRYSLFCLICFCSVIWKSARLHWRPEKLKNSVFCSENILIWFEICIDYLKYEAIYSINHMFYISSWSGFY